jgi:hypothetical protein
VLLAWPLAAAFQLLLAGNVFTVIGWQSGALRLPELCVAVNKVGFPQLSNFSFQCNPIYKAKKKSEKGAIS